MSFELTVVLINVQRTREHMPTFVMSSLQTIDFWNLKQKYCLSQFKLYFEKAKSQANIGYEKYESSK